jgi:hypothetical protein
MHAQKTYLARTVKLTLRLPHTPASGIAPGHVGVAYQLMRKGQRYAELRLWEVLLGMLIVMGIGRA